MTIKQIKKAIAEHEIPESKIEKLEIVIAATKTLSKNIQETLVGVKMHKQDTLNFLYNKHFKDALLDAILYTLEFKETANPLKRSELESLENTSHLIEVCEKLSAGIIHAIGVSDEDDDSINLMLQEVISHYIEELEHKLENNQ